MASDMFLYWGSGSVPCWKVMLVLEEKGLQGYGNKLLSFEKKEHKSEEILKLNPRGQLPTFKDGDIVVNESNAICDYLEYKYSSQGNRLLPQDPAMRGRVLQRMHEVQNLHKALIEGVVYYQFRTKPEDIDKDYLTNKKEEARNELKRWEDYMNQEGAEGFLVGKSFTMADVFFFPLLAFGVRGQLDLPSSFPKLHNYYTHLVERPSVKATWPPHWKEGEGKNFFEGL